MVKTKEIIVICLVMSLVVVALPLVASADTSQYWYLHNDNVMYKGDTGKDPGTLTVTHNTYEDWRANEPTNQDVTFPAGKWKGEITLDTAFPYNEQFEIHVGYGSNSGWNSAGDRTITSDGSTLVWPFSINASEFTVDAGAYLKVRIINFSYGTNLDVTTGEDDTYVTSPPSDPGYPIPELPTIVLLATGLVGLAAYFGLKRRKRVISKV